MAAKHRKDLKNRKTVIPDQLQFKASQFRWSGLASCLPDNSLLSATIYDFLGHLPR